jgi:hypothetical protein
VSELEIKRRDLEDRMDFLSDILIDCKATEKKSIAKEIAKVSDELIEVENKIQRMVA